MQYLDQIKNPSDMKKLNMQQLQQLSKEVRARIVSTMLANGGHLASNLGTVELTIALHYVFSAPQDKIIFDVGHQCYTHKILTGRNHQFGTIRCKDGLAGFPKRDESQYDVFNTGHSSTSISAGLGFVRSRDLLNQNYHVISVIGDGSISGGMALEALNNIKQNDKKFIVVLNDNEMSISKNVGALSDQLAKMRLSRKYLAIKSKINNMLQNLPLFGGELVKLVKGAKNLVKKALLGNIIFEQFGLTYLGPVDGHDLPHLVALFQRIKNSDMPILLHVVTKKGKGYAQAEHFPDQFHGVAPSFETDHQKTFSTVVGETLCGMMQNDRNTVAITAAMTQGTGLKQVAKEFPNQFFDVGIAEQHAVTFAAGMAANHMKPFVCIYSTFLQRAYDQILHDVCLQNLPVTFLIDRAGFVGKDGETHQGIYDLSFLSAMPNMQIFQPFTYQSLQETLQFCATALHPTAIRYPSAGEFTGIGQPNVQEGYCMVHQNNAYDTVIVPVGLRMAMVAQNVQKLCKKPCAICNILNLFPILPQLQELLTNKRVIVLEEGVVRGGFGEALLSQFHNIADIKIFGTTGIVAQATVLEQVQQQKLSEPYICQVIDET